MYSKRIKQQFELTKNKQINKGYDEQEICKAIFYLLTIIHLNIFTYTKQDLINTINFFTELRLYLLFKKIIAKWKIDSLLFYERRRIFRIFLLPQKKGLFCSPF